MHHEPADIDVTSSASCCFDSEYLCQMQCCWACGRELTADPSGR